MVAQRFVLRGCSRAPGPGAGGGPCRSRHTLPPRSGVCRLVFAGDAWTDTASDRGRGVTPFASPRGKGGRAAASHPPVISDHPGQRPRRPGALQSADALAQHQAGQEDRHHGVERREHRDHAQQPLGGGDREQALPHEVERADHHQRRHVGAARKPPGPRRHHQRGDQREADQPAREDGPCSVALARAVDEHEERPEPDRRHQREPHPARHAAAPRPAVHSSAPRPRPAVHSSAPRPHRRPRPLLPAVGRARGLRLHLTRGERHAGERQRDPRHLERGRPLSAGHAHDHRNGRGKPGDRRHDTHGAHRQPAVEGRYSGRSRHPSERGVERKPSPRRSLTAKRHEPAHQRQANRLGHQQHAEQGDPTALQAAQEVAQTPGEPGPEPENYREQGATSCACARTAARPPARSPASCASSRDRSRAPAWGRTA